MNKNKLESIGKVLLGLKMLYCCTIPNDEFEIKDKYFGFLSIETKKLILGKLYVLLADDFKGNKNPHNTISFNILISEVLNDAPNKENDNLKTLLQRIKKIDKKYKLYRDKVYAHTDLTASGFLEAIEDFNISDKDITDLIELAEEAYDALLLSLNNASSDKMKDPIDSLSSKIWKAYGEVGLVEKIK